MSRRRAADTSSIGHTETSVDSVSTTGRRGRGGGGGGATRRTTRAAARQDSAPFTTSSEDEGRPTGPHPKRAKVKHEDADDEADFGLQLGAATGRKITRPRRTASAAVAGPSTSRLHPNSRARVADVLQEEEEPRATGSTQALASVDLNLDSPALSALSSPSPPPDSQPEPTTATGTSTATPVKPSRPTPPPDALLPEALSCPICMCPPKDATLTPCGHVMCGECLFMSVAGGMARTRAAMAGRPEPQCPVCRATIDGWDGKGGGVTGLFFTTMHAV